MDVISLPMLSTKASINEALGMLKVHPKGGIILEGNDDSYSLVWAGQLLAAREIGVSKLSRLPDVEAVYLSSEKDARLHSIDLIRPFQTVNQYLNFFNEIGLDYSLVGAGRDVALIITRSEQFAWTLASTGGYQCDGPTVHYFPKPRVNAAKCAQSVQIHYPEGEEEKYDLLSN